MLTLKNLFMPSPPPFQRISHIGSWWFAGLDFRHFPRRDRWRRLRYCRRRRRQIRRLSRKKRQKRRIRNIGFGDANSGDEKRQQPKEQRIVKLGEFVRLIKKMRLCIYFLKWFFFSDNIHFFCYIFIELQLHSNKCYADDVICEGIIWVSNVRMKLDECVSLFVK